jgi:RNA polymerase sigma-70 factor (ECF subfamily)
MLVEHLRAGDEAAYEMLVRRYGGRMLATARRMLGSEPEARDAVQDALLSAFRSIERFEGGAQLSTWLHRIVVNAALMRLRSRRRRREDAIDDLLPRFDEEGWWPEGGTCDAAAAEEPLERDEVRARVRRAIAQLPETYRTVLTLRDIEDLDPAETARALGISTNAVKSRLHRARQALKTLLERDGVLAPAHAPSAQAVPARAGGDAGSEVAAA